MLVPNPELNWGVNIYAPNGDLVDRKPGLVMVLTSGVMYILQEDPDGPKYSLTTRPVDSPNSKVFYGYPGSPFRAWALATDDRPFELSDANRINSSIACIRELADTDQTRINSLRIDKIGNNYRSLLTEFLGQVPLEVMSRIAILEDEFKDLIGSGRFDKTFLKITDQMEELGLAEIQAENMDLGARERFFSVTPAWLRHFYRQQAA